jgi:hypothetical protein
MHEEERFKLIMAAIDDLVAAVSANTAATIAVGTAVTDLVAQNAAGGGTSDADIEAQVALLNQNNAALTTAAQSDPGPQPTTTTPPATPSAPS